MIKRNILETHRSRYFFCSYPLSPSIAGPPTQDPVDNHLLPNWVTI